MKGEYTRVHLLRKEKICGTNREMVNLTKVIGKSGNITEDKHAFLFVSVFWNRLHSINLIFGYPFTLLYMHAYKHHFAAFLS